MPTISHSPFLPAAMTALRSGTADQVRDVLVDALEPAAGEAAMRWLRTNRPAIADQVLCLLYGLWWYQVDASTPSPDAGKWFISVEAGSELNIDAIPLCESEAAICSATVAALQLEDVFFGGMAVPG